MSKYSKHPFLYTMLSSRCVGLLVPVASVWCGRHMKVGHCTSVPTHLRPAPPSVTSDWGGCPYPVETGKFEQGLADRIVQA